MTDPYWDDPFWRDGFHLAAFFGYVLAAKETGQNPPDSEAVRVRAYELYEQGKRGRG